MTEEQAERLIVVLERIATQMEAQATRLQQPVLRQLLGSLFPLADGYGVGHWNS